MALKTLDITALAAKTGNLYETVAILSKRARQIATQMKQELDEKLSYFEGLGPDFDDPRHQEEQRRISIEYELKPEPTEIAVEEFLHDEIYYRDASKERTEEEELR
ncbi:MAG: DNA-directed RNA polymerase subunit omega [Rhodothermus sp.]|nr:DNA-directed RNA polymerase subunit omega [Rhodothermus sp.]